MRLQLMMFLEFAIWGSWQVTAARYLGLVGFSGDDIGWMYAVGPIAGMISPFFVGVVADRFFATERVLGALHLIGGGALLAVASLTQADNPTPLQINLVLFVWALTYFPTIALANSLAFHTMQNPEKEFPLIRVFGTFGWIAAGILLTVTGWGDNVGMFHQAGGVAILLGLYSFTLPHTPPPAKGQKASLRQIFGLDAMVLLKNRSYLTFLLSSFLICIPLAFYYQLAERTVTAAGIENPPFKMTFGQMSEIFFMLVMPWFFARLGVKWMLLAGMAAWVLRYALFAMGAPESVGWMVMLGVLLHGICYDFFFVTGQIYTDQTAPPQIRSQAQGLLVLFTLGLGMFIGALVAGRIETRATPPEFATLNAQRQAAADKVEDLTAQRADAEGAAATELDAQLTAAQGEFNELTVKSLQTLDWKTIWGIPAGIAAVILVVFALIFREDRTAARSAP
jgi:nucleoside transporter